MSLTIVTHRKPHLDEVVAGWLLKNFDPAFADATWEFITQNVSGGDMPAGEQYIGLGVGRGKFDEHGLQKRMSATKLVYDDLLHRGLIPNEAHEDRALTWLVDFAHKEDTGQWETADPNHTSFSIPAILRGAWQTLGGDQGEMDFGLQIIDAVMARLNERARFLADWDRRTEFMTPWGKAVALTSTYKASDVYAYHEGFVLRVQADPTKAYGDFRAPANSAVDLSDIFTKVEAEEPGAWFLHQSKKLLIAGNDASSGRPLTKKTLEQLIALVKS